MSNKAFVRNRRDSGSHIFTTTQDDSNGTLLDLIVCQYQNLEIPDILGVPVEHLEESFEKGECPESFERLRVHVRVNPNHANGEHVVPGSREHPYIITALPAPIRTDMEYEGTFEDEE